jgi:CRP/FNR family transcriptional regulator
LQELCLPGGLTPDEVLALERVVSERRRLKKGETIYQTGDAFAGLYAIRFGSCKTAILAEDGHEQVSGYHMVGDIVGLDGIGNELHSCECRALEDSEVCLMPFAKLEELARSVPSIQHHLHRVMSREIVREHGVMLLLGSMRAEERLAVFLLNLSQRYQRRGYSASEFHLRMTREEIGSYLGLKLETVSRLFSRFQDEGLIEVRQRSVRILDLEAIKKLVSQPL